MHVQNMCIYTHVHMYEATTTKVLIEHLGHTINNLSTHDRNSSAIVSCFTTTHQIPQQSCSN